MGDRGERAGFGVFRKRPETAAAERLLTTVNAVSRQGDLYGEGRIPDTLDGRLEALYLHAALALMRLKAAAGAGPLAQAFTDRLFRNLDEGLREAGVGDLSVPRTMQKLARAFYGRLAAYQAAIGQGDRAALAEALSRNVFGVEGAAFAPALAAYAAETAAGLALAPVEGLERLDAWRGAP